MDMVQDRANLAFAAPTLNRDLHLSSTTYGLAAGLFFFTGYTVFQAQCSGHAGPALCCWW